MNAASKGALVASIVASLAACAAGQKPNAERGEVKCSGINACKGQGACSTAENSCAGGNSCKGKGWVVTTADDCKAKGGTAM